MLATYWKMFFVTVPRDPSMNIPMLIRMQWKRFCSTLRMKIFNKILTKISAPLEKPWPHKWILSSKSRRCCWQWRGRPRAAARTPSCSCGSCSPGQILSVLLIYLYRKRINFNRNKKVHLDDNTASLSYKDSTVPQLKGSVVTSLLLKRDICW